MPEERASRLVRRDSVVVAGVDAQSWLQGQLTQEIADLGVGETRLSLVLSPQGKLVSFCRVTRTDDERLLLDVEEGFGSALEERLRRFKLRVKSGITTGSVVCEERLGGGFSALGPPDEDRLMSEESARGRGDAFEASRIIFGVPRLGRELSEQTIPQEAGDDFVARTVSFTKGCYTGQELVARLDARGSNVPRRLRLLRSDSRANGVPRRDDVVKVGDVEAGRVTSAVASDQGFVALAYVRRAHLQDGPLEAEVVSGEARLPAMIVTPERTRE